MAEKETKHSEKKTFFEVKAPLVSSKILLYANSVESLDGSIVKLDLTRTLRGKNLEMKLRVKAAGQELFAEPISLELLGSYIRKMMRTGTDYVEDSFNGETKDSKVIMKVFMITRNKVSRSVRKELRNTAREYLQNYLKTRTSKEIFTEIMTNKAQKDLSLKLKKIYPLALCEIRFFKVLTEQK